MTRPEIIHGIPGTNTFVQEPIWHPYLLTDIATDTMRLLENAEEENVTYEGRWTLKRSLEQSIVRHGQVGMARLAIRRFSQEADNHIMITYAPEPVGTKKRGADKIYTWKYKHNVQSVSSRPFKTDRFGRPKYKNEKLIASQFEIADLLDMQSIVSQVQEERERRG